MSKNDEIKQVIRVGKIPEYCFTDNGSMAGRPRGRSLGGKYADILRQLEVASEGGNAILVEHITREPSRLYLFQKLRQRLYGRGFVLRVRGEGNDKSWLWIEPIRPNTPFGCGWLCGMMGIVRDACPHSPSDGEYDAWMRGHSLGSREAFQNG
jgi:hypothetical protein